MRVSSSVDYLGSLPIRNTRGLIEEGVLGASESHGMEQYSGLRCCVCTRNENLGPCYKVIQLVILKVMLHTSHLHFHKSWGHVQNASGKPMGLALLVSDNLAT